MRHLGMRTERIGNSKKAPDIFSLASPLHNVVKRAALLAERKALRGKKVAAVLSVGNVDAGVFAQAITGGIPEA